MSPASSLSVVLAEDDAPTRRRLTRILIDNHYAVTSTGSGSEALEAIRTTQPDLFLLDLTLPDVDGLSVLERLKEMSDPQPRVVVLTARRRSADIPKALKLGAAGYILKPIDDIDVEQRINTALESPRRRAAQPAVRVRMPELHNPSTGRIAADKVAEYLGVKLKQLSEALGANYTTVHKTPAADSLQTSLAPIKRSLEILGDTLPDVVAVRAWLNSPHPDLGGRTPLSVILEGKAGALRTLLENALKGIPA